MKLTEKILLESSLSRVLSHIENYDIACISASRDKMINCVHNLDESVSLNEKMNAPSEERVTPDINARNTKILKAKLLQADYGVTDINGNYIENFGKPDAKEVMEKSFLVVNIKNDPNFLENVAKMGEAFCQDSVLLKPKGQDGYLYGTNYAEFPGYGEKMTVGQFKGGKTSEFLSRIRNRPFVFEHIDLMGRNSRWAIKLLTNAAKAVITFLSLLVLSGKY